VFDSIGRIHALDAISRRTAGACAPLTGLSEPSPYALRLGVPAHLSLVTVEIDDEDYVFVVNRNSSVIAIKLEQ